MPDSRPISADFDDVHAGRDVRIGDTHNYYSAVDRPPGLHVNVPAIPPHFVGREELVARVARRLIAGTTLALSADGLPGVGKTTLAVALAYRREILDHFTDGVLWGALGLQPNVMEVLATWAAALGIDVSEATDPTKRAALVRNAIGQRCLLLVIDDAWAPAENALLLKCGGPSCVHFLTTRDETIARAFAGTAGKVEIHELEPDDALELLKKLAPEACEADPDAARELVRAVGYLPLAIELMGAYLSATENRYFREQQTAALRRMAAPGERLRQVCTRLGNGEGTKVTLRDAILLSLEGLPEEAVDAFNALGAFAPKPETFDSRAAEAVTGASLATLSRLIERHLLEKERAVLSVHQTVADVANERAGEAVERHALYYLGRVRDAGEDWRAIGTEYAQVKWAFTQLVDPSLVLSYVTAVRQYQRLRCLREDALHWNAEEVIAAEKLDDRDRLAIALNNRGYLYDITGNSEGAVPYYLQALEYHQSMNNRQGEATSLQNLGALYQRLGQHSVALDFLFRALTIRHEIKDTKGEATTLNNIGVLYNGLGERTEALKHYESALALFRECRNEEGEAGSLNNIGAVYLYMGQVDAALEYFGQALPLRRSAGDVRGEAVTLSNMAAIYRHLGERKRALEIFYQVLPILQRVRDRHGEAVTLNNLGLIYGEESELDLALEHFERALPLEQNVGNRSGEAVTLNNIGAIHQQRGNHMYAMQCFQEGLALCISSADRGQEAMARRNIAALQIALGELGKAVEELERVVALDSAVQSPYLDEDRQLLRQTREKMNATKKTS